MFKTDYSQQQAQLLFNCKLSAANAVDIILSKSSQESLYAPRVAYEIQFESTKVEFYLGFEFLPKKSNLHAAKSKVSFWPLPNFHSKRNLFQYNSEKIHELDSLSFPCTHPK